MIPHIVGSIVLVCPLPACWAVVGWYEAPAGRRSGAIGRYFAAALLFELGVAAFAGCLLLGFWLVSQ